MNKLKAGLLAAAGIAAGVLTLRTLRQRRGNPDEEPAAEVAQTEARAAVEHATEAVSHARVAGEKTVEYVKTEADERRTMMRKDGTDTGESSPVRRLRKVGKGWIRR